MRQRAFQIFFYLPGIRRLMKLAPECVPCFLKRVLYEVKLVSGDERLAHDILRECSKILASEADGNANSAALSTEVHRKTYGMLGNDDPYRKMKEASNRVAFSLYRKAEKFVAGSKDPFRAAVIASIVGNIFDYGITDFKDPKLMTRMFSKMCADGLGHDDTRAIKKAIKKSKEVLFFTDNCGEIVFDKLLLREIRKYSARVTLVVKGVKILSDATAEDAYAVGADRYVDEIITTERFAVGIDLENISRRLRERIRRADFIICKGMANYESFSDTPYRPIAYLMRTKCLPVAKSLGVKRDISAAKLVA
jgi:hypothetical protein